MSSEGTARSRDEPADPLYAGSGEPSSDATPHTFGGVEVAVQLTDTDPDTADAQYQADRTVALVVPDALSADDLRAALPAFLDHARAEADRPTEASVTLPSRDIDRARVVREGGLAPTGILAVADLRGAIATTTRPTDALLIRSASPADADAVTELWWQQADYEARIGVLRTSPAIRNAIAAQVPELIAGDAHVLVAATSDNAGGEIVGAVVAQPPEASAWATAHVAVTPLSYLEMASTAANRRGKGIGSALVAELHARHVAAGIAVSTLHYSAFNPLSVPFWSRHGYRPLVTHFGARVGARASS